MITKKLLFTFTLLSLVFISGNLHNQTSIEPVSSILHIKLPDDVLKINVNSPGIKLEKYPDGTLKHISLFQIGMQYEIDFHYGMQNKKERIAKVLRFGIFNGVFLLHGQTFTFHENGEMLTEINWEQGQLNGTYRIFNEYGILIEEKLFEKGIPVGTWKHYYPDGTLAIEQKLPTNYKDWENTSEPILATQTWFDEKGNKQRHLELEAQIQHGNLSLKPNGKDTIYTTQQHVSLQTYPKNKTWVQKNSKSQKVNKSTVSYFIDQKKFKTIQEPIQNNLIPILAP